MRARAPTEALVEAPLRVTQCMRDVAKRMLTPRGGALTGAAAVCQNGCGHHMRACPLGLQLGLPLWGEHEVCEGVPETDAVTACRRAHRGRS